MIQCIHCDRWLHAICDGLRTEDEAERASEYGYHCLYCRPKTGHLGPCKSQWSFFHHRESESFALDQRYGGC